MPRAPMYKPLMNTRKTNDFLNGVPELLLLRLLERRPMYGYQLVQSIRLATCNALSFGEGCIYPVLHRLEAEGHLRAAREQVTGRSRVVYRLTEAGRQRLTSSAARWEQVVVAVSQILKGGDDGEPELA
jgi:PadR family transcriptional regulator, regulatory protein PadR